jgi:hypothetical protein
MTRLGVVGAAVLLFLQVARCEKNIANVLEVREAAQEADGIWARNDDLGKGWTKRETDNGDYDMANVAPRAAVDDINWDNIVPNSNGLVPGEVAAAGDVKYKSAVGSALGSAQLDGRALVAEWLNPRGLSKRGCLTAGYEECSGECLRFPGALE